MTHSHPASLALARKALRFLIKLNWLAGVFILALLIAHLVAGETVNYALGLRKGSGEWTLLLGARLIMVAGLMAVPITNIVLERLLAIVDTVGVGDPFISENARRLQTIGWAVLCLQMLNLSIGIITTVASTDTAPLNIKWSFSLTGWLAVLLLFVLARVFEHGAHMREELEGTI